MLPSAVFIGMTGLVCVRSRASSASTSRRSSVYGTVSRRLLVLLSWSFSMSFSSYGLGCSVSLFSSSRPEFVSLFSTSSSGVVPSLSDRLDARARSSVLVLSFVIALDDVLVASKPLPFEELSRALYVAGNSKPGNSSGY